MESELKDRVQLVINHIRPQLQADGGDIELVDIVEGVVRARLKKSMCRLLYGSDDFKDECKGLF